MPNVWEEGSEEEEAQWALGANAKSIGEHLWGYVRSDTVYRCWVVKWRILRQHKLVNSKQHVSEKTEPMFWEPGGEWRGSWLSEEYRRSFAAVLPISSWVFGKSAGAKKPLGTWIRRESTWMSSELGELILSLSEFEVSLYRTFVF